MYVCMYIYNLLATAPQKCLHTVICCEWCFESDHLMYVSSNAAINICSLREITWSRTQVLLMSISCFCWSSRTRLIAICRKIQLDMNFFQKTEVQQGWLIQHSRLSNGICFYFFTPCSGLLALCIYLVSDCSWFSLWCHLLGDIMSFELSSFSSGIITCNLFVCFML